MSELPAYARVHYLVVVKKTGQPYIHSGPLSSDHEEAIRKHFDGLGHEVRFRTRSLEEAQRLETTIIAALPPKKKRTAERPGRQRGALALRAPS